MQACVEYIVVERFRYLPFIIIIKTSVVFKLIFIKYRLNIKGGITASMLHGQKRTSGRTLRIAGW